MIAEPAAGPLAGRKVLVGVTGGIAAYKAADLVSRLVELGAQVDVAMTPAAGAFVTAGTFAALSQRPVHDDVLERWGPTSTGHVSLAQAADVYIVVPATANSIARLASGMADDMVGSAALAATCPLLVAPAMEHHMWRHPATVANVATLQERGVAIVGPESGHLASGEVGDGRLAAMETLIGAIRAALGRNGPLAGRRILVSAGGTREPLDPVRFLGNRSSGRMGRSLAEAAIDLGATVDLVTTVASHAGLYGADVALVETAAEMADALRARVDGAAALVMCAAVADYRPARSSDAKLKRADSGAAFELALVENPDILRSLDSPGVLRVGFAAETDDLVAHGQAKLAAKRLDLVVVNEARATIGGRDIRPTLLFPDGSTEELPLLTKEAFGRLLMGRVAELLAARP